MPSLFEKINTLISANLHGLVDRALEGNSLKVMDEYIRQVERNLEALEDSAATVGGTVRTLKRKYEDFASQAEKLDRDIDTLVIKGQDNLAAKAQAELNTKQELAQEYYEQWQAQESQYQKMLDMRLKLEHRLTTIKQEREKLRSLIELAETKKVMTKTVKGLDDLANTGDMEIDGLTEQIRARLDREDARLEIASQSVSEEIDEAVGTGEVDRQLEERRRRLLGGESG
jgi:phage shock protein A